MPELTKQLRNRAFKHAVIIWLICVVFSFMALDGGQILGAYAVASLLFWPGAFVYLKAGKSYRKFELFAFRLGPFILFFAVMLGMSLLSSFDLFR